MNTMTDAILGHIKDIAFEEGVRYALEQLRAIYGEGIEETDIWAEYANKEGK